MDQLLRLWFHFSSKRKLQLLLLVLLTVLGSIFEMISIGAVVPFLGLLVTPETVLDYELVAYAVSKFKLDAGSDLQLYATTLFVSVSVFSGFFRYLLLVAQTRMGHAIGSDLGISIYTKSIYQPYSVHVHRNSSEIISGITVKANQVVSSAILPVLLVLSSSLVFIAVVTTLFIINASVATVALTSFGSIYVVIMFRNKAKLASNSIVMARGQTFIVRIIQETLGGIREVILNGLEPAYLNRYIKVDKSLRKARAEIQIAGGSPRYFVETVGIVLISGFAFSLAAQGSIAEAIPMLGALALAAQRILPALQQGYSSWTVLKGGRETIADALVLLDQKLPTRLPSLKPIVFEKEIAFDRVTYRYSLEKKPTLQDISFSIKKGQMIGLIGSTGSGKSTLLNLILGLIEPISGRVLVDGEPIGSKNMQDWYSHVSFVPQDIFLLDGTIEQNIAFGAEANSVDKDKVRQIVVDMQLKGLIEELPLGLSATVGENGAFLSGGQKQRIGLARALYSASDLLVLDEATSALDYKTEDMIMNSLYSTYRNVTKVLVAHRLSTLKNCDVIFELENGRIERSGNFDELEL